MRITEKNLRRLTRSVIKELFAKKRGVSSKAFLDRGDIDIYDDGGGEGFYEGDEEADLDEKDDDKKSVE